MITVSDADRLLQEHVRPGDVSTVFLAEAAGRVLRDVRLPDAGAPS